MRQRTYISLGIIILLLAIAVWIDLPNNPGIEIGPFKRSLETILGLDLRGGLQVLLEVDLPSDVKFDQRSLEDTQLILENRTNALGVSEVVFQVAGERRIVGEFPGVTNPEQVVKVIKETGLLEFVDMGDSPLNDGTIIKTDFGTSGSDTPAPTPSPTQAPGATPAPTATENPLDKVWHTVMTGSALKSVAVTTDQVGQYQISFELTTEGAKIFRDHTTANVGKFLAIVLDKKIISAPRIQNAITEGQGVITGSYTYQSANELAVQLRYGSLPIPLKVVESRVIGPTLGQDSLDKSLRAGIVGFIIVALFMMLYYRVPGIVAILTITFYGLSTFALFKLIPVTLTLPGIAGFLLSTGSALDANILIFERLKEELRSGRTFIQAVELALKRAWPSIRDSNFAIIITCTILFWFGSSYGATIVKGFAFTLAVGVGVSMFSALVVTRTFLEIVVGLFRPTVKSLKWFGVLEG
jgi:preprotein translocase subunit SecD